VILILRLIGKARHSFRRAHNKDSGRCLSNVEEKSITCISFGPFQSQILRIVVDHYGVVSGVKQNGGRSRQRGNGLPPNSSPNFLVGGAVDPRVSGENHLAEEDFHVDDDDEVGVYLFT
jgi:hypothetical protein